MPPSQDCLPRNRFKAVEDDLACCLCGMVPRGPVMAPCQHICCPTCATGWKTCPQCGAAGEFGRPGKIVQGVFDRLELQCENAPRGCDFILPFARAAEMEGHLARCGKAACRCPHDGCAVVEARDAVALHEMQCEQRPVRCDLCGAAAKASTLAAHKATVCQMAEVECGCGQRLRRRELDAHGARCPTRVPVVCPVVGCGRSVPQGDLEAHLAASLSKHLQLMNVAIQEREGAMARLTEEVQAAKQKLTQTEGQVAALEADQRDLKWYGMGLWHRDNDGSNTWTIGNMTQKLKEVSLKQLTPVRMPLLLWSPQHYTHPAGYRFSLRLDFGSSANVGLFVHLHEGENDDRVSWPFNLDYTVRVGSMTSQITQRDSYMHYTSQGRPPHELSWGWANFCSLEALRQAIHRDGLEVVIYFHTGPQATATANGHGHPHAPQYNAPGPNQALYAGEQHPMRAAPGYPAAIPPTY